MQIWRDKMKSQVNKTMKPSWTTGSTFQIACCATIDFKRQEECFVSHLNQNRPHDLNGLKSVLSYGRTDLSSQTQVPIEGGLSKGTAGPFLTSKPWQPMAQFGRTDMNNE